MGRTLTDFSQLSKGMFRKSDPVVEVKPLPPKKAAGDDALAYFGLNAPEAPTRAPGNVPALQASGCPSAKHEPRSGRKGLLGADNGRIQSLEANVAALRARYGQRGTGCRNRVRAAKGGRDDKGLS